MNFLNYFNGLNIIVFHLSFFYWYWILPFKIVGLIEYLERLKEKTLEINAFKGLCTARKYSRLEFGVPTGIRTPVTAVKGRCPRPLDDRDVSEVGVY